MTDPNKIGFKSLPNNSINKNIENNKSNSEINSRIIKQGKQGSYYTSKNLQTFNNLNNIKTQCEESNEEIPSNYQNPPAPSHPDSTTTLAPLVALLRPQPGHNAQSVL